MRRRVVSSVLMAISMMVCSAGAQTARTWSDKGSYSQFGLGVGHDSSVGWTTELDSAVGYDFNRAFSVDAGVPLYLVSAASKTTSTGSTVKQHYNSLGDAYLGLSLHPQFDSYAFSVGLVGTAPTGSRKNGISTGRATATVNGRVETDISRLTPFAEATFGNSLSATKRYLRPFTTLGAVSTWTGGTSIDLTKKLSFEASAFDVLPFGDQKIYSHASGQSNSKRKRVFEQASLTSGSASIAKDHGFSGDFSVSPTKRLSVDLGYTRSIAYALDTYSGGVSFRFGHIRHTSSED